MPRERVGRRGEGQCSATVKPSAKDRRGRARAGRAAVNRPSALRTEFTTTSKSETETSKEGRKRRMDRVRRRRLREGGKVGPVSVRSGAADHCDRAAG